MKSVMTQFLEGQKRQREHQKYLDSLLRWSPKYRAELTGLVPTDSEANTDSSNSPTEATQERKES